MNCSQIFFYSFLYLYEFLLYTIDSIYKSKLGGHNIMKHPDTPIKKILFLICFTILFYLSIEHIEVILDIMRRGIHILLPFIIGACIAFVINIPMKLIEESLLSRIKLKYIQKHKRCISVIITVVLIAIVIMIVILLIVPELINTFSSLISTIPGFFNNAGEKITNLIEKYPQIEEYAKTLELDWAQISNQLITFLRNTVNSLIFSTVDIVGNIVNGLFTSFIAFTFAMYILFNKEMLAKQFKQLIYAYFSNRYVERILKTLKLANTTFSNFISGQCTEAIIIGLIFYIVLTLLNYPYTLLISVFIAFMSLIPMFGAFISSYASAFLILMINPIKAIAFLVLFAVIQQLEDTFIYPKVVGNSVGLPSIWVLVAVTLGGSAMGLVGMLVFIPLCSMFYTLVKTDIIKRLRLKQIPKEKWLNK